MHIFIGTFFRHLEKGSEDEATKSSLVQDCAQTSASTASDLSSSEDENEQSEPEESVDHELGS